MGFVRVIRVIVGAIFNGIFAPISQLAEDYGLNPFQSGFEFQ